MIRKLFPIAALLLLVAISAQVFHSCKESSADRPKSLTVDPAFKEFIDGYTTGPISTESGIIVRLNFDVADSSMINTQADPSLFVFDPSITGKAFWIDSRTIQFIPDKKLPRNVSYTATFNLSMLTQVPDSLSKMVFSFHTVEQDFEIFLEGSKSYSNTDLKKEKLSGYVLTADEEELDLLKKIVFAEQNGKPLNISWSQEADKKKHWFSVDSISRGNSESEVTVAYNGSPIGCEKSGKLTHTVYPLNVFKIVQVKTTQYPELAIIVQFTDPLQEDQELEGLISYGEYFNYSYVIHDNELFIYPESEIEEDEHLTIEKGIKNCNGKVMDAPYSQLLVLQSSLPDVRFVSSGVILPSTNGLVIPFEAINLKAVDVKIIRIYENNIPQFLQVNELSGKSQLSRVGKTILKKTVSLGQVANYNRWNRFYLDISEMIETEPGAIYSVEITCRREFSTIPCTETDIEEDDGYTYFNEAEEGESDWSYYSDWDGYYYDDYYYYDWSEREDPCTRSYYSGKRATTNILATDIGLTAKAGESGSLTIFATNIVTAEPMEGVELEIINYQLQTLTKTTTDSKGIAIAEVDEKPFLIIARKDKQQSYLKLGDGSALSLSSFDVSGERTQQGIKGFVYTERGVWRSGDSLYVGFILEDGKKKLPPGHPVIFELYNPIGTLIEKRSISHNLNGFFIYRTATAWDAITGIYRLIVRVGKTVFYHNLRVEAIKPNRLRIELNPGDKMISLQQPKEFTIESQWLHGAVAKNLKVEADVTLKQAYTTFPSFQKFVFDDPGKHCSSETVKLFHGKLDENGKVVFLPSLDIDDAPGFLTANIETRVYEPGGEFSIDFQSIPLSPFKSYVGILPPQGASNQHYLYTDRAHTFRIVNVTETGKLTKNETVQIEVFKMEWKYWWSSYDDYDSEFMNTYNMEADTTCDISLKNGAGSFTFKVDKGDWGRYYIRVTDPVSGHSAGMIQFFDWYGYNRFADEEKTAATMLTIATDKSNYTIGDEVKISFKAPTGSRAYISIEKGSEIISTEQVTEQDGQILFSAKVTEEMAPNIYISVSLIQPHPNTVDGLPIRMYGIVPVFVENPNTILKPVITAPAVMRPGQQAEIAVSETNGKPMTYTLAIVDEGLLNLTKFKTPDPHSRFYSREALGIRTWDIYDLVIGAYGTKMQRILSIGGGGDVEMDPAGQRANRFKPMVRFIGPFELGAGKSNVHNIQIPEYVGSVRIMVVAGQDKAYGSAQKAVPVRNPLMVLGTAPRVIGPGETFRLPVSVFAMEDHVKNVKITLQTNQMFTLNGSNTHQLTFERTGEDLVAFELKAGDAIGVGQILVTAESGNEKAVWKIEIDVRPANPPMTKVTNIVINEGETWESEFQPMGIEGTTSDVLEVSTFIPMNIDKWLNYLIDYPHGCAEQTISGAFPLLYADVLAESNEKTQKKADTKIRNAIFRIQNLQLGNGAIAMWPGSQYGDEWTTSYAGHFLIEAQIKGYIVSKQFMNKWKSHQKKQARQWRFDKSYYNNDLMQAYRLYTLAIAGEAETGAMNRLAEEKFLSAQAKWVLASAYTVIGRVDVAKKMISKMTTEIRNYNEYSYTYGSQLRDKSFILETYIRLGMNNNALEVLREIATELGTSYWLSTQTVGQSLRSVALYLSVFPMGKQMNFSLLANNSTSQIETKNTVHTVVLDSEKGKPHKLMIKNTGKGTLYVRLIQKGIPKESDLPAEQNNLNIQVVFKSMNGKTIQPDAIPQGTIFYAEVKLTHPGMMNNYSSMALTQVFPSGWEVMNDRYMFGESGTENYTYQDIRDDRVLTYFNLNKAKSITVKVRLSASYIGTFYMPMIYCEAMYNNQVNASVAGKWVKVVEQGEIAGTE